MLVRHSLKALSFTGLVLLLAGCGSKGLNSVQITPSNQSVTVGQTAQFTAVGTYGNASHSSTQNITSTAAWTSSVPAVATVSSSGIATGVSAGTTVITANATAFNGPVSSSATLIVSGSGGGAAQGNLVSITIIPSSITVGNLQDTGQFLAIGTFSNPPSVRDLTNLPTTTWISATPSVFPVNTNSAGNMGATAGIVTAYGSGSALITAEVKGSDGSIQTASATFNCPLVLPNPPTTPGSCYPGSQAAALLATLTVYNEGLNTTNWLVTAPSATGTPQVLNCGPGAGQGNSVCVATYPVGTTVTLTAPAKGATFGGWSSNCTNTGTITAAGPNTCTVTLTTNDTVGAIFN
ncbi:MAG: Ig-like domain-containing protein [Acidobacteriaceae bacterium]